MKAFRITLISILGLEHSGTTLLALMLGAHRDAITIGGLKNFQEFSDGEKKCTCQLNIFNCPFWSSVLSILEDKGRDPMQLARELGRSTKEFPKETSDATLQLIRAINAASEKAIIVEGSRQPRWTAALIANEEVRVVPVHIFKRPIAQALSAKRRRRSLIRELLGYRKRSRVIRKYIKRIGVESVTVSYDALCSDPERVLRRIMEICDSEFEQKQVEDFVNQDNHMISGNRIKYADRSEISPDIAQDEDFTTLERISIRVIASISYRLNKLSESKL